MTFCDVLNEKTGLKFDLPTEAQWEYACRGGKESAFYNGKSSIYSQKDDTIVDEDLGEIAWYGGNWNWIGEESGRSRAVGLKKANDYGIYDMSGCLWEFCLDLYGEYDLAEKENPVGSKMGNKRVVRGGSWHAWPAMCRSANRHFERGKFLAQGFRVVCKDVEKACEYITVDLKSFEVEFGNETLPNDEVHKTDKLVLRRIPKGTFVMGSPEDENGRDEDEVQHTVTLTEDFYICVYPVTQAQWQNVMGNNPSSRKNDLYPVETIEWSEIRSGNWPENSGISHVVEKKTLCGVLNEYTGLSFDLPTEAQWEYACRAGEKTAYYNGLNCLNGNRDATVADENLDPIAWYAGNYSFDLQSQGVKRDVGMKLPNNWGLYDMLGNDWEYCKDWFGEYTGDAIDPIGPSSGVKHVCRGGNWHAWPAICRCAKRQRERGAFGGQSVRLVCLSDIPLKFDYLVVDISRFPEAVGISYTNDSVNSDEYKLNKMLFRRIKAGEFIMGSPEDEVGRDNDETQHKVTLTKDYFIGVYEITQKQWEIIMNYNPSIDKGEMRAVENIAYEEVCQSVI